jgi:hypothetical protein
MAVLQLISYHDARMAEEAARADAADNDAVRRSHMELAQLHFRRAGLLRGRRHESPLAGQINMSGGGQQI